MSTRLARRTPGAYTDALLQHRGRLPREEQAAGRSLRRLARQVEHVAQRQGLLDVAKGAVCLAAAPDRDLYDACDRLLAEIRRSERRPPTGPVLVVDDDPALRSIITAIAQPYVGDVVAVASLKAARSFLSGRQPAVAVIDLGLPDGDGRDLVAELGADLALQAVPVLVLTASTDAAVRAECLALGAREVHQKPIDPVLLTNTLAAWLGYEDRLSLMVFGDTVTGLFDEGMIAEAAQRCATQWIATGAPWCLIAIRVGIDEPEPLRRVADALVAHFEEGPAVLGFVGGTFYVVLPGSDHAEGSTHATRLHQTLRSRGSVGVGGTEAAATSWTEASRTARRMADLAFVAGQAVVVEVPASSVHRHTVLLVDDNPIVGKLIEGVLTGDGLQVVHQPDGSQWMASLERLRPSLVILDLDLPGRDGVELLEGLRRSPRFAELPVLVISAHSAWRHEVAALRAGADDFLRKPLEPEVLRARVARLLTR